MSKAIRKTMIVLAAATVALATVSVAQNSSPADTIKMRQKSLKDLGAAFKTIRDQLRGDSDAAAIKAAATDIKKAADAMHGWFPKGTGPEAGIKTGAKPEIWSDGDGFAAAVKKFEEEAGKFADLANTGDMSAVRGGMRPLGQACGGCHDKYRVKEED